MSTLRHPDAAGPAPSPVFFPCCVGIFPGRPSTAGGEKHVDKHHCRERATRASRGRAGAVPGRRAQRASRDRDRRAGGGLGVGVGGIVAFVGPLFDYSGDGSGAWQWNLPHAVLALLPGVAGVLLGLFVVAQSRGDTVGRGRLSVAAAGMLLMVCGAWFAVGPLAWPVISHGTAYFVGGTHLRVLAYEVGYSIGTGLVLVACGAFVDGWASRHRPGATAVGAPVASTEAPVAEPMAGRVEAGI